jgi:hypothetical protein
MTVNLFSPRRGRTLALGLAVLASCSDQGAESPAEAIEEVAVERGAPITAPVEAQAPAPTEEADSGTRLDRITAIQVVAAGIENLETSNITVIDDLPSGVQEEGVQAITWRALSLREIYGEHLRGLLSPENARSGEYEFPAGIQALDGQSIAILGYMIPLEWDDNKVPEFMLVRDLMGCCFGSSAQPDEWIDVRMVAGEAEYISYMPVVVIGELSVGSFIDDAGYQAGCYHIDSTSVQMEM